MKRRMFILTDRAKLSTSQQPVASSREGAHLMSIVALLHRSKVRARTDAYKNSIATPSLNSRST